MVNRREFLHTAAGAAAASAFAPLAARTGGANDRVRIGLIGCGIRGNQVMSVSYTHLTLPTILRV